jgi:hypothetical protein
MSLWKESSSLIVHHLTSRRPFPRGLSSRGVKLTTHLHLVPMSRMRGAIPPLPQYLFLAWCLVKHSDNFTFTFNPRFHAFLDRDFPDCWTGKVGPIPWLPHTVVLISMDSFFCGFVKYIVRCQKVQYVNKLLVRIIRAAVCYQ